MLVVARHPHALEVRSLLSKTLCDLNRLEAATEVLEQGISLFPREPALFEVLARVLLRQQRLEATRAWEAMLDMVGSRTDLRAVSADLEATLFLVRARFLYRQPGPLNAKTL